MITRGPNNDRNAAGLRKLADLVASGAQVKVGVPAGTTRAGGKSMGMIAAVHEFGAHVPPHSRIKGRTMWFHPRTGRILSRRVGVGGKYRLNLVHEVKAKPATYANGITIPARPFLRPAMQGGKEDFARLNARSLKRIARNETDVGTALGLLGNMGVGKVKMQIRNGNFAPLSRSTIRRKGSSKPLQDSGQLVQSITYRTEVGTR